MSNVNLKELQSELAVFEKNNQVYLDPKKLIVIRLDMRAGGSFVKKLNSPWDYNFTEAMKHSARVLLEEVSGAVATFVGSDEITLVIYPKTEHDNWNGGEIPFFNGRTDKILSLSASIVSNAFNERWLDLIKKTEEVAEYEIKKAKMSEIDEIFKYYQNRLNVLREKTFKAHFDSRVFQPGGNSSEEAIKVIFSRMNDVKKNSIQMLARKHFSHKELQQKNTMVQKQMLFDQGIVWEEVVETDNKYGSVFFRERVLKDSINNLTKEPVQVKRNIVQEASLEELYQFVEARTYEDLFASTLAKRIVKKEV